MGAQVCGGKEANRQRTYCPHGSPSGNPDKADHHGEKAAAQDILKQVRASQGATSEGSRKTSSKVRQGKPI